MSSPLATFFGVDFTSDDQQDMYLNIERDRNDWVQECMAKQGFEYRAIDPAVWENTYTPDPDAPEWGTREWAETYGFGVSTQMFDQVTVGSELMGNDSSGYVAVDDPNQEYMNTLSNEETSAYYEALYGNSSYDWDPSLTDEENDAAAQKYFDELIPTGCENQAQDEFQSADPWSQVYTTFGDELDSMYARVQSDPEITKALDDVSRCVSDKGFSFVSVDQINEDLYKRLEPVNETMTWPGDNLTEDQWGAMSEEEMNEMSNAMPVMSDEGRAMLAEIQAYEIEVGTAAFDCGNADLDMLYMKVSARLEQSFVDSHRAELEALKPS